MPAVRVSLFESLTWFHEQVYWCSLGHKLEASIPGYPFHEEDRNVFLALMAAKHLQGFPPDRLWQLPYYEMMQVLTQPLLDIRLLLLANRDAPYPLKALTRLYLALNQGETALAIESVEYTRDSISPPPFMRDQLNSAAQERRTLYEVRALGSTLKLLYPRKHVRDILRDVK